MHRRTFLAASAATTALAGTGVVAKAAPAADAPMPISMLAPWPSSRNGAPAFDKVKVADFKPALMAGMDRNRAEIAAIAADTAAPTFANTIAALEDAGRPLGRAGAIYGVYTSTLDDKAMQAVEQEMAPILAAFSDEVVQNAALFERVKAVYDARETSGLTPEQQRLTWVVYRNFARHGAALRGRQGADGGHQPAPGHPFHHLQPERTGRRGGLYTADFQRGGSGRPAGFLARWRGGGGQGQGPRGASG